MPENNHNKTIPKAELLLKAGQGTKIIKYVALGDSLTYGFGATNLKGTFPYVFAQRLLGKYSQIEVSNLAVSGATSEDLLQNQLPQALEIKPNLVTIMIGTNDVHNFISETVFRTNLESIIDRIKNETPAKIILINIPYLGTKNLILPPYNKIMDFRIRKFNRIVKEVADKKQIQYFDIYSSSKDPFNQHPDT